MIFIFFLLQVFKETKLASDLTGMARFSPAFPRAEKSTILDHSGLPLTLVVTFLSCTVSVPYEISARQGPGPRRLTGEAQCVTWMSELQWGWTGGTRTLCPLGFPGRLPGSQETRPCSAVPGFSIQGSVTNPFNPPAIATGPGIAMCPELGCFQSHWENGFLFLRAAELIEDSGVSGGNCQRMKPKDENHPGEEEEKKSPLLSKLRDPTISDARP